MVLDNLSVHEGPAIRAAIRAVGARFALLPPYSPGLTPIKEVFAKIKHALRKAEDRTREHVRRKIDDLLATVTPAECENYVSGALCFDLTW